MQIPTIHYDHCLGNQPGWREAILRGLQGDEALLTVEYLSLRGYLPGSARQLDSMFAYAKNGQQAYVVGPRLQEMLSHTKAQNIPVEFMRLPYPCFYVALPEAPWSIWGNEQTGWHPLRGIYVNQWRLQELQFHIHLWGQENDKSARAGDDAVAWIQLDLNAEQAQVVDADGQTLIDIDGYLSHLLGNPDKYEESDPGMSPADDDERQRDAVRQAVRLVFNLVLYVNSIDPETMVLRDSAVERNKLRQAIQRTSKAKKKRILQRQLEALSEARVVWIGPTIERDQQKLVDEGKPKPTKGTRASPTPWTFRKGFFRHYWTGPRTNPDGSPRTDAEGNRVYGDERVIKWFPPKRRNLADILRVRGTRYRFRAERGD